MPLTQTINPVLSHPRAAHSLRRAALAVAAAGAVLATVLPGGSATAAPRLTLAQAEQRVHDLDVQAEAAVERYNSGRIALADARRKVAAASAAVAKEQAAVAKEQAAMASIASSVYRSGGADEMVRLLTTTDPKDFLDQATSLDQLARTRSAAMLQMRVARKRLATSEESARQQAEAAVRLNAKLASDKSAIERLLAEQRSILSQLRAEDRARLERERAAAAARASRAATTRTPAYVGPASGRVAAALREAYRQIGKPYSYGAAGPNSFDCSGLTMWAFARAGISLPHSAAAQYGYGTHVSRGQLQPGDLVFFSEGGYIGHVGIYVGGGKMLDAPHTGSYVGVRPLYSGFIGGTRL